MDIEVKAVVDAINNISTTNPLKDYMFPLLIVLIGGFFAHYSTTYLRYLDAQKEKLDIANDWILGLSQAFTSLKAIKSNYIGKLTDGAPLDRAVKFPQMINSYKLLELQINKLSFVAPKKDDDEEARKNNHMNPEYISALQSNYNYLINTHEKRSQMAEQIIPIILKHRQAKGDISKISPDDIHQDESASDVIRYLQLNEHVIKYTDELLIAIHNFLCEFPDVCRYAIDIKRVKHHKGIIERYYDNMEDFKKSTPLSYSCLAKLFKCDKQQAISMFSTEYEDIEPIEKTTEMLNNPNKSQEIEKDKKDKAIKKHHRIWWR